MKREKGNWGWRCYLALAVLLLGFWGRTEVPKVCATDLMMPVAPSSDKLDINVKASPIRYGQRLDQSVLEGSAVYSGDQPKMIPTVKAKTGERKHPLVSLQARPFLGPSPGQNRRRSCLRWGWCSKTMCSRLLLR